MNTTSKASNAFEAFFGIHELPPSLLSTSKAWKSHWRNPMTNIGIDIIETHRFQSNVMASTTRTRLEKTRNTARLSHSLPLPLSLVFSRTHTATVVAVHCCLSLTVVSLAYENGHTIPLTSFATHSGEFSSWLVTGILELVHRAYTLKQQGCTRLCARRWCWRPLSSQSRFERQEVRLSHCRRRIRFIRGRLGWSLNGVRDWAYTFRSTSKSKSILELNFRSRNGCRVSIIHCYCCSSIHVPEREIFSFI